MPEETRNNRSLERHTGADALIKFDDGSGYVRFPVTSVDWSRDYSMEEIQHDGSMKPTLATTNIRYSGSFEYTGQNPEALETVAYSGEDAAVEQDRPVRGTLTIKEFNHDDADDKVQTITFQRVLVSSTGRDLPSDGTSSTSFDWAAENMTITNHTNE